MSVRMTVNDEDVYLPSVVIVGLIFAVVLVVSLLI